MTGVGPGGVGPGGVGEEICTQDAIVDVCLCHSVSRERENERKGMSDRVYECVNRDASLQTMATIHSPTRDTPDEK